MYIDEESYITCLLALREGITDAEEFEEEEL